MTNSEKAKRKDTVTLAAWLAVGIPLAWGVVETLKKAMALFGAA